ncbi:hypothetical protein L1987_16577 [Smallanthus sonchifolius]|uniref:Uncharacterized protein n=1 Tax=Smallanthus sonchifolius TaxID=185202 RepID=A0ACB9IVK8_9ASTR|nr:hypothetical protein L1987_16577 [Smallanthus sonchifolius]
MIWSNLFAAILSFDFYIEPLDEQSTVPVLSNFTPSVPIPSVDDNSFPERVSYSFVGSLSRSHTPTVSFFHSQRTNANKHDQDTVQEPLLGGHVSRQSPPASETNTMLCVCDMELTACEDGSHECYRNQVGLNICYCYKIVAKDDSIVDSRFMHEKSAVSDSSEAPLVVATPLKVSSFSVSTTRLSFA